MGRHTTASIIIPIRRLRSISDKPSSRWNNLLKETSIMAILLRKAITPIATANGPQGACVTIGLDVCCFVSMRGAFQESKLLGICKF